MTALDPLRLTAREAKRLLVDGEISSAELTKVYLDQIAAVESKVRAYILVTADNAAKYSTKVDREMQAMRGPLAGLPIAVKDNMVTEGVTTTCASRILAQLPARLHGHRRAPGVGRPRGHARQDQPGRVRHGLLHRELGLPGHAQPLGPRPPCPAAPAAAPPPPSPPARRSGRSAPTPAAPSASRPRSAASSA